ncbi:MAG: ACP S-malonyltransferase [Phycisphaerae bacterium]
MKFALLCPGQGAQFMGMGKDFFAQYPPAREVYETADAILGFRLSALCFNGPDAQLQSTDNAQAAIFVTSMAIYKTLLAENKLPAVPDFIAGLSLGEYTALCIAGVFSFEDGLKLVRARGELMQAAATAAPSTMLALVGADAPLAEEICRGAADSGIIVPANFNAPGQIVLSGAVPACQKAAQIAEARGVRAVLLSVAGAFHSPFMQSAADGMNRVLAGTHFAAASCSVISNVTGQPHGNGEAEIKTLLVRQIIAPVRWYQSMEYLKHQGVDRYMELGPGRVLTGLHKRIDRRAVLVNVATVDALKDLTPG